MANVYFNNKFEICSIKDAPDYLYVDDVDAFIQECLDECDDVESPGVYHWNDYEEIWEPATSVAEEKIRQIIGQELPRQGGNIFIGWNILITLDTGETIRTNSEPISIDEAQEAINILLKPSFFGKRIKKFEIVAE